MDLWAPFRLLDDGKRLGKYITHYRNEYFTPGKTAGHVVYNWKLKPKAADRIYSAISDITISMQALNHLKMPQLLLQTEQVELTEDEQKLYETLKEDLVMPGTDFVAGSSAILANKLAQLANGGFYLEDGQLLDVHQHKLDALEDLIESMQGQPLLVAYWFKFDLERIKQRFPEARELKSGKDFADWNAKKIAVGLIHPASAGHGLNLQQGGNVLVWFGLTWSLELYQQTNARLYRQGQSAKTVVIKHIITKNTIDDRILHALSTKAVTQEDLVAAVKAQF
jgi:SNF2 family DNA or RNA helicase